jgi:spore maturation protein CgeB
MKILCVFGKHQYGDPSRGLGTEYVAFLPALRNLGHEVVHFDSWDRTLYENYGQLNQALLSAVHREQPHVMLAVQLNYEIWAETLELISRMDHTITICWTTDDSWKYREVSRFIGRFYHVMTTTDEASLPKYRKDGIRHVLLTQWGTNSVSMRRPLPAAECSHTVTFVGEAHGNRKRRIEALSRLGLQVTCFGYGWPGGPVPSQRIPQIMRESVISLNFANARGRNQIKARTFETPGSGGFLLTEYVSGIEKYYIPGREIETFKKTSELARKIRHYLNNPEKRDRIAIKGYERSARDHTYETRMEELLAFAFEMKRPSWFSEKNTWVFTFDTALSAHQMTRILKLLRLLLVGISNLIWGRTRGPRAARRLVFEVSWRFLGEKTFTASGLPGRMFPEQ